MKANLNFKNIMTKIKTGKHKLPTDFFVVCKESRIENPTSFYGCFYIGPFDESLSQTLANDLRRTLLSELTGLAITSIEIEGVLHKFSSISGMKESVLDLISNFQNIVLKKTTISEAKPKINKRFKWETSKTKKTYTGFLNVNGPRVIKARDLKLPSGLQCVDPNQYILTLAQDGFLNIKFNINEGKNFIKQKPYNLDVNLLKKRNILIRDLKFRYSSTKTNKTTNAKQSISNPLPLDAVFMPVTKINCIVEENKLFTDFSTDVENNTTNFQKIDKKLFIGSNNKNGTETSLLHSFGFKKAGQLPEGQQEKKRSPLKIDQQTLNKFTGGVFSYAQLQVDTLTQVKKEDCLDLQLLPDREHDLNFADFFLHYTNKPETCFVPTKNKFKLIPWESNTLYFDLVKYSLLDTTLLPGGQQASEKTKFLQPSEHLASKIVDNLNLPVFNNINITAKNLFWELLKKNLKEDETTFNNIKIFLALNQRHLEKKTAATQQTLMKYKAVVNKSRQKKLIFKIKHEKLQHNILLEYNKTLKLKPLRKKTHVIVEIWTNGSIHPREALYLSFSFLSNIFLKLQTSFLKNYTASILIPFKNKQVQADKLKKSFFNKQREAAKHQKEQILFQKKAQIFNGASSVLNIEPRIAFFPASFKAPIGVLTISLRVYTALKKEGILTIEDLLKYTKKDLLKIKNFGVKSLFELETQLSNLGLFLKTEQNT